MPKSKKPRDPLPDSFASRREAAEFWDRHDTEDYAEYWKPIHEPVEFAEEAGLQIKLSPQVAHVLQERATASKVSVETLVNRMLEESIRGKTKAVSRIAETHASYRKRKTSRK